MAIAGTAAVDESLNLSNLELEQAVLGTLLGDTNLTIWPQIAALIRPEHFSEPIHARIYEAAAKLAAGGTPPTALALITFFSKDATLAEIGGKEYLAGLVALAAPPIALRGHAEMLVDLAARRAAIAAAQDLVAEAQNVTPGETFRPQLAQHVEAMQELFDKGSTRKTTLSAGEAASAMMERIALVRRGEPDPNAVKTGIDELDRMTGGLHRGEFIVLGARPSVGKSALATQIALNIARRGGGVAYFSLEMSASDLTSRMISSMLWSASGATNVPYERIRQADLAEREERWVGEVAQELDGYPFIIDTAVELAPAELEARANIVKSRLARAGKDLNLVVIDHMHRMTYPGARSEVEEYSKISARLAEMAKRLEAPVLCLAQLNRGLESREDKRPQLADLRSSGSIEQDADVALFVHRPGYHLSRERHQDMNRETARIAALAESENLFELLIEKQRNGPTGFIELHCDMASNVICSRAMVDQAQLGRRLEVVQ